MTKPEKKAAKSMRAKSQKRPFIKTLAARLGAVGRLPYWARMYRRKCVRKGVACPLDKLGVEAPATADDAPG